MANAEVAQKVGILTGEMNGLKVAGDVNANTISVVQVYVLNDAGRRVRWGQFLDRDKNRPPYKFLYPYTVQDHLLFKGRDREIEAVVNRVDEQRLVIVRGQADIGKTSLLSAGVIPKLVDKEALVIHVRDYLEPITERVRKALKATDGVVSSTLGDEPDLPVLLHAVCDEQQRKLVLILDQFERIFEPEISPTQREALIKTLAESLQADPDQYLRLIIAVRDDYLPLVWPLHDLWQLEHELPVSMRTSIQLLPLDHMQARSAIEDPVKALGFPVTYAPGFVGRLVHDLDALSGEPGIMPSELQIVCHSLYQAACSREGGRLIDGQLYKDLNWSGGIMASYLQKTLDGLEARDKDLAERIVIAMASPGVDRWVFPDQLPLDGIPAPDMSRVVKQLVDAELLLQRAVDKRVSYAFASHSMVQHARRLGGAEAEQRAQAGDEVERIWSEWLTLETLASPRQLRYLAPYSQYLQIDPLKALLLLQSAVVSYEPTAPWLACLQTDGGRSLVTQLDAPEAAPDPPGSRTSIEQAERLLGLAADRFPDGSGTGVLRVGRIARASVADDNWATRQTAAAALAALDRNEGLLRLDRALGSVRRGRWWRGAEARGAQAEADPAIAELVRGRSLGERGAIWLWRVVRLMFAERKSVGTLTLGGGIGAGLALALVRGIVAIPTTTPSIVMASLHFYYGGMLGAALILGMTLGTLLLLRRLETLDASSNGEPIPPAIFGLVPTLPIGLGALVFGAAHVAVALLNGAHMEAAIGGAPLACLAGLGLSTALYPQASPWRVRSMTGLARLVAVAIALILARLASVESDTAPRLLVISWSERTYWAEFSRYIQVWWPALADERSWSAWMALLDAVVAGLVLAIGTHAGVRFAARWLARWRIVIVRSRD